MLQDQKSIQQGKDPNAIIYDAATKRVFTFNNDDNNSTAFDANSGEVVGTIDLGGQPAFAASDDNGHLFVNLMDKSLVLRIDSHNLSAGDRWPVACGAPTMKPWPSTRKMAGCSWDAGPIFVG